VLLVLLLTGGLLHSIPTHENEKNMSAKVTAALRDCVAEKKPGGRVNAVNALADLLAMFVRMR